MRHLRQCAFVILILIATQIAHGAEIIGGPWLQHVTQTSITVMWETDVAGPSVVEYGTRVPLNKNASAAGDLTIHEVTITDLAAEKNYFYRVVSGEAASEVYSFQTAVNENTPFAYVVVGDNRTNPENWGRIAAAAYAERPNFVVNVGDVVTDGNVKAQWLAEWIVPAADLMRRVPHYVAIGNHENDAHWYYDYVAYPAPENYYSFDYGNAHFTIVDSNQPLRPGTDQYEWIARDLAKTKATWKFVAHHHPPVSSDEDDYGDTYKGRSTRGDLNVRRLMPLYEKHGVDICWFGHIHDYERTWPLRDGEVDEKRGVVYIQTGGGGAGLENFAPTRSWFTAKVFRNWQYCLVTMHNKTLRMMAYDIEGNMFDFLELKK
jgi:calcineurin-like phosphoesterase family protein/purple acid phosphatase-like protein